MDWGNDTGTTGGEQVFALYERHDLYFVQLIIHRALIWFIMRRCLTRRLLLLEKNMILSSAKKMIR